MPLNPIPALSERMSEVRHGKTSLGHPPIPLAVVAAIGENGVIGDGRGMPWHLPSDLKHFRSITLGKPVLVGRKTFESIGRVLPGREMIVVTRDPNFIPASEGEAQRHVHIALGLEEALDLAQSLARATQAEEIILAGGGNLYENLISRAEHMHLTFVDLAPSGSVRFPRIDWSGWLEVSRIRPRPSAKDEATFAFVDFDRRHCLSL